MQVSPGRERSRMPVVGPGQCCQAPATDSPRPAGPRQLTEGDADFSSDDIRMKPPRSTLRFERSLQSAQGGDAPAAGDLEGGAVSPMASASKRERNLAGALRGAKAERKVTGFRRAAFSAFSRREIWSLGTATWVAYVLRRAIGIARSR